MKKTLCIVLVFGSLLTFGQLTDDFSDGDFTTNPAWTPDNVVNWIVQEGRLQSNAATANSSFFITTPSARIVDTEWRFFVNLQFNTSSANYVDVYLSSAQANLNSATNSGYFVRIGGTPDEVSLYKMTAGIATIIINGTDGITNFSNNSLSVKVTCSAAGQWSLERDDGKGQGYVEEGTATDLTFLSGSYFGLRVQQSTASFFNRHFFDDFYAGDIIIDSSPPRVQSVVATSSLDATVTFDEKLELLSAQQVQNYRVDHSVGHPASVVLQADQRTVLLHFNTPFANGFTSQLTVAGVKDVAGNSMAETTASFLYFEAKPVQNKDVLITEIMADPAPVVQLPEAEYLELYNRSSHVIDLAGWTLSDPTTKATLSSRLLLPQSYLVLTSTTNASRFSGSVNVLGVSSFPSINNDGEPLVLKSPSGITIDSVYFSSAWYRDEEKRDGGWSLELIDTANVCGEEENWVASEDEQGGTPGRINSVNANKPDLTGPALLLVTPVDAHHVLFQFNEKLEKKAAADFFHFDPALIAASASFTDLSLRTIQVTLDDPLINRQLYHVQVTDVRDCNGNLIQEPFSSATLALPEAADVHDLLINEILFNPRTGGVDFVEVYNTSPKDINLKNAQLSNYIEGKAQGARTITGNDRILVPNDYVVLTSSATTLKNHYPQSMESKFVVMTLPGFSDDAGTVAISTAEEKVLDHFAYSEKYHSSLLKDKEGVSLERISITQPTEDVHNWRSANASSGFATPGYLNSNTRSSEMKGQGEIEILPEIFSVGMPGSDFVQVRYRFEESGQVANVKIYDQQGRPVKEIANNETLGDEGMLRWDGDCDDGSKARSGYYLVWFETFNMQGKVQTYRKRVVIAPH